MFYMEMEKRKFVMENLKPCLKLFYSNMGKVNKLKC